MDSSVNPSGSLSITSSPSAEKPSKVSGPNGEKHVVSYLHEIPLKSPSIHTPYGTSVIAPVCALSVPSVHTSYISSIHTSYGSSVIAPVSALSDEHVHTSCITSVVPPVSASPIPSVCLTDDKCQKFPDKFPGTNYGENLPFKIMAKIPDDVTPTLHQAKFPEETPGNTNGVKYMGSFPVT